MARASAFVALLVLSTLVGQARSDIAAHANINLPLEGAPSGVPLVQFDAPTSGLFVQSAPRATAEENDLGCDKDIDGWSEISGATFVAAADTGVCTNTDLDTFVVGGEQYVIVGGGEEAAFTILRYAPLSELAIASSVQWALPYTYTADVKTFTRGGSVFAVLFLERRTPDAGCGVVIVDVSQPADVDAEDVISQTTGVDWCDVHNGFVESIDGEGRYLYITANATRDMRVLDIQNPSAPVEIAGYRHPNAGNQVFVHDVTVFDHGASIGRRAYLSYWAAGVIVLDADTLTAGQPLAQTPLGSVNPPGIRVHHALPDASGDFLFLQDEYPLGLTSPSLDGDEPVQMWKIRDLAAPSYVDGIDTGTPMMPLINQAHNLELPLLDLDNDGVSTGDVLFVGWYRAGLRAYKFGQSGFTEAILHHQVQTEIDDAAFEGSWGARVVEVGESHVAFHSDRKFGLIADIVGEDPESDGVGNAADNCHLLFNPDQSDGDGDLLGDVCEAPAGVDPTKSDTDGDGCADGREARRLTFTAQNGGWRDPLDPLDFTDLDDDLVVTILDVASQAQAFQQPAVPPAIDLDGDGIISVIDISTVSSQFLHSCK